MPVIRVSKTKGFTVMSNYHLQDKNLSLKAKGLLSMMLSLPDGWHYNVRGLAAICKEGVSSISSTIRELDACGYIRRHQPIVDGKFQEIEYIIYETPQARKLSDEEDASRNADDSSTGGADSVSSNDPEPHTDMTCSGNSCTEIPCTENPHTGNPYTENPNTQNQHAYKRTKQEKTKKQNTHVNNYPSINQARKGEGMMELPDKAQEELLERIEAQRLTGDFELYREMVKENIDFDSLCIRKPYDRETLEGIVEIIVEVLCSKAPYTRINGQDFPTEVVKSRFMKLDSSHIDYVMTALSANTTRVRNIKAYLLSTLYNAPMTINPYYQNWVLSDNPQFATGPGKP